MYKIMIVEDEPPIIRHIKRIIARETPDFEVLSEAYNGEEALRKIAEGKPDIVITDIKMPVMSGIELAKALREFYPQIVVIIISGYPDFHYAKEALRYGVADYLLKPVEPDLLCRLLSQLAAKFRERDLSICTGSLKKIARSATVDPDILTKHFHFRHFSVLAVRIGALPGRFGNRSVLPADSSSLLPDPGLLAKENRLDACWMLEGRDERELFLVFPCPSSSCGALRSVSERVFSLLKNGRNFMTIVFTDEGFELEQLPVQIRRLTQAIDHRLVIGKDQTLDSPSENAGETIGPPILPSNLEAKFNILIQEKSLHLLKDEISKLFHLWEKQSMPQIWVEKMLRQILRLIEKNSPLLSAGISIQIDQQLEAVFSSSNNFTELLQEFWNIVEELISGAALPDSPKHAAPNLLASVDAYVRQHISDPLTLQSVCDLFGISQPYLSRLFRKYKNESFNEYVTHLRVDEAKRLMQEDPGMLFKNIAEIVGYQDQHYFSRIFRTITGTTPSQFKEQNQESV